MYPFRQNKIGNKIIREFSSKVNSDELVWHRDRLDRHVYILEGKEWYIQIDNEVPQKLIEGNTYFIPAHNYHRLIKGQGNLKVSITENDVSIIRRQIRKIIKESILNESAPSNMHRCMNGKMVPADSMKCLEDILSRIEDAEHHRTSHSCGTENRVYYNGLLKGLRKKRNRLQKKLNMT